MAQGGGNLVSGVGFMSPMLAARAAGLVDRSGSAIISQDGSAFLPTMSALPALASLMGQNSNGLLGANASGVVNTNGSSLIGQNNSGLISNTAGSNSLLTDNGAALTSNATAMNMRSLDSVGGGMSAVMTGPSTWTYGQAAMITWTPKSSAAPCASGYRVLINGKTPVGSAVTLSLGKSLLPAGSVPRGTVSVSLVNVCTGSPVAAPLQTRIQ